MATKSKEAQCVEEFQLDALAVFHERLTKIKDKRRKQGLRYPLVTVLMTMLLACMAGANSAAGFEMWAKTHEEELSLYLDMPHGPPTQDVFLNILATLDVEEFETLYQAWIPVCTALQGKEIGHQFYDYTQTTTTSCLLLHIKPLHLSVCIICFHS